MGLSRGQKSELTSIVDELQRRTSDRFPSGNTKEIFQLYKEVRALINKVLQFEKGATKKQNAPSESRKDFGNLVKWLQDNGAKIVNLKVENYGDFGCGLKATSKVKKGDLSVVIPKKLMLTFESAASSSLGHTVKNDVLLSRMPNVSLALHLVNESLDPESFWSPYIKTLPEEFTTVFYFDEDDVALLQKSAYFEEIVRIYISIARQYSYIYKLVQTSTDPGLKNLRSGFTYDRFRRAVSVAMTRQNMIPTKEGGSTLALIPFFDLANHERGEVSTDYDELGDCSKCYSMKDFEAGEQFFIDYGRRSIAEQFLHNGFISDDQYNQLPLNIPLSKSDPLQEVRSNFIAKFDLAGPHLLSSEKESPISGKFLGFLRIYVMKEEKLKELASFDDPRKLTSFELYDKETDEKTWNFLQGRCKLMLMMHQTSIEEDMAKIAVEESPTKRLCLRFLAYEKQLLVHTLEYSSNKLQSLSL